MKFGFLSEGDPRVGQTYSQRYWDLVDQVILADKMGFDVFGTSEQHFALGIASISAPECLYPYLFAKTERIRFRHAVALTPYLINHPLRIAERVATQDILSRGRMELGTGRGNTMLTLRGFGVDIETTRDQWEEAVDLIRAAFTQDPFTYQGKFFQVPPRSLVPKPLQYPHPPMFVASTGPDSLRRAAQKGLGVITSAVERGWSYVEDAIAVYKKEIAEAEASGMHVNNTIAVNTTAHCAPTVQQAIDEAGPTIVHERKLAGDAFARLSTLSPDYAYLKKIVDVGDNLGDLDYLRKDSGSIIIGDPDNFVENIQRFADLGADEVWFRLDSLPHELICQSIELIGRYVIPQFKDQRQIVQHPEIMRRKLREKRAEIQQQETAKAVQ
ncbi:MAG: LLM class flavin-dependent oxidoreductase [Hyphomicrobiales bacterium]|nr:LLM class flavin-dependent oxidoreductase [Hyphomicrobiales bacterium]